MPRPGAVEAARTVEGKSRIRPGVASGSGRLQRPAVRAAFWAFSGWDRDSGNNLKGLEGVHFWGHFRGKNHELASVFPEPLLSQRFEAGPAVAPGHFWA